MLDRIDKSNAAMVAWAADFDKRYPVRGWPPRKTVDTVTWWLLVGVNGVLEIEEDERRL